MRERLKALVAAELELPIDRITDAAGAETLEAWDSLGHLKVILAVEQAFDVRFSTAEIPEVASLELLLAALAGREAR